MSSQRNYYEAYDDRYRQVHEEKLRWFSDAPSPIVAQTIAEWGIGKGDACLEIGCGEGRDAKFLLERGYDLLATDISPEAVDFCRRENPEFAGRFQVLDCIGGRLERKFDFIYAVAVIHMLVRDGDRRGFYAFLREQLAEDGVALVCTMGDGQMERSSDISTAFDLQERSHPETGRTLRLAGTSCRVVSFETFRKELDENGLAVLKEGITAVEPDFPVMMYAVVKKKGGTGERGA